MSEPTPTTDRLDDLRARVAAQMPRTRADLEALTRIPSVSLNSFDPAEVERSAQAVAQLLRAEGMDVEILREGGHPAVIGRLEAPAGAPTVLLYAHHDVQPPGDEKDWDSPPFEPTERDGRLYGRGAADDKAGVMAHLTALRAHDGRPPVGVTVFVEGEEEVGSDSLATILERHGDRLAADAIVLADSTNWEVGTPALTTTLRGMFRLVVTVRTLDHSVHSGMYGGPVPDALTAMVRLLATLHDDAGDVAVEGFTTSEATMLDYPEQRLRVESGLLDGVQPIGTGSILSRLWTRPSVTTIGIDAPTVDESANALTASARAKVSVRIHPSDDPRECAALMTEHLRRHAPWGAHVEVELEDEGAGFAAQADGPVYDEARRSFADAWGTQPVDIGVGGSIPFVAAFAERFPDAAILVTGVEDPDTRAHGANESLHLGELQRACLAEAVLLERLGATSGAAR